MTFVILLLTRTQGLQEKWKHIMMLEPLELTLWSPNVKSAFLWIRRYAGT